MSFGGKSLESVISSAKDAGFRARATTEYNRIRGWTKTEVNWDSPRILDFGCGSGVAATSIALRHPKAQVFGVDINPISIRALAGTFSDQTGLAIPDNVSFSLIRSGELPAESDFDLIYAWSVFEHVQEDCIIDIFRDLKSRLKTDAKLFLVTEPLYYSPNGSHLYRYHKTPWHHLIMSLDKLRDGVISENAEETQLREWQQFMDLNRLTAQQIREAAVSAGFEVLREQIFRTGQEPPERLTHIYQAEVLTATGVQLLLG